MRASAYSGVEPAADAGSERIVIRRRRQALLGVLLLVIASAWVAVPVRELMIGGPEIMPGLGVAGLGLVLAVGLGLAATALSWIVRREIVVIDRDSVGMTDRRPIGTRSWHEPLSSYHGVRLRKEQRPHRYGSRTWSVVELWHPETAKTIELTRTRDPRLAADDTEAWARRLALPPLQEGQEHRVCPEHEARGEGTAEAAAPHRTLPAA